MSSRTPDRYIDRTGIVSKETMDIVRSDELSKAQDETQQLREENARLREERLMAISGTDSRISAEEALAVALQDKKLLSQLARVIAKQGGTDCLTTGV